jgi:hypothetical protein
MIDIEEEWEKLMANVRKQILDKEDAGELSTQEADELLRKAGGNPEERNVGWNSSGCSIGSDYDDGWSPSLC